jgi:hypothetical protein
MLDGEGGRRPQGPQERIDNITAEPSARLRGLAVRPRALAKFPEELTPRSAGRLAREATSQSGNRCNDGVPPSSWRAPECRRWDIACNAGATSAWCIAATSMLESPFARRSHVGHRRIRKPSRRADRGSDNDAVGYRGVAALKGHAAADEEGNFGTGDERVSSSRFAASPVAAPIRQAHRQVPARRIARRDFDVTLPTATRA